MFYGERGENDENIVKYLISKGARLPAYGMDNVIDYYLNYAVMKPEFILYLAINGLGSKASNNTLMKLYDNFPVYINRERGFSKPTAFEVLNNDAKKLLPLINKLIKNGVNPKSAYFKFSMSLPKNRYDWIKILLKPLIETNKIDINKDFVNLTPFLGNVVAGVDNIDNIRPTVQYLLKLGANPLLRRNYSNKNCIDLFCENTVEARYYRRPLEFYPQICRNDDLDNFKLLFTDKSEFEKQAKQNINLEKAYKAYEDKNFKLALKLFLPYAKNGNMKAQEMVGELYDGKKGIEADQKTSMDWFEKAAKQGSNKGQFFVGLGYELGLGRNKDKNKAKEWFLKAYKSTSSSDKKKLIQEHLDKLK